MSAVVIPVPARPPDPYHVFVTPADPDDPALDDAFADSVIGDARSDVIVLVCGPEHVEVRVESVRSRDRVARALAVTAGLLATHGQLFVPGAVVHACWEEDRRSA